MNKWTLTFKDTELEQKYQKEQNPQQIDTLRFTLIMSFLSCLIGGIFWILEEKYIVGIQLILSSITSPLTYYFVVYKGYCTNYVTQILSSIHLIASLYQFIPFFYTDLSQLTQLWFTDLITIMITQFTASSNLIANVLLWAFFLIIKIGIRQQSGFCLLSLCFSLFIASSIYNDYGRVKILRELFLQKTKNIQSNNILDTIISENIVTLYINQQQFKFNILFTNKSFLENISEDAYNFLKQVHMVKNKNSLFSVIYEQITNQQKQSELEGKVDKQRFKIQCLIQYFDDIIITINIRKLSQNSNLKTLQFPFYKSLLKKVKQNSKKLHQKEKIKHLLTYILYAPHLLNLQVIPLQFKQLQQIMSKYCYSVKIRYQTKISSIILLIDVYLYLLVKLYNIQKISINQTIGQSDLIINLKLIRNKSKGNIRIFNKFKDNIMDSIATQDSTIDQVTLLDLTEIAQSPQFRIS